MIEFILNHKKSIIVFFLLLAGAGVILIPLVNVNYDLALYLPQDSLTKRSIEVMKSEFGYPGMANVMFEGVSIGEAIELKEKLKAIDGVKNVIWLDDFTDVSKPLKLIPESLREGYYKDNNALFTIQFEEGDYSLKTGKTLEKIREQVEGAKVSGSAESSRGTRNIVAREATAISLVVVPICIIILIFASNSWVEPFLFLFVSGIAIVLNMGSNIFFDSISFITSSMSAILQLAISMDYSLFLLHRYREERDSGLKAKEAVIEAAKKSLPSILASALTTVAGFMALVFMGYSIGADLGLVLAKGIFISLISVLTLLPVIILIFNKQIEKTRHRPFIPPFDKIGRFSVKFRYILIILLIIIALPAFLGQRENSFLYGDTSASSTGDEAKDRAATEEVFGISNPVMLIVPNGDVGTEREFVNTLEGLEFTKNVQWIGSFAGSSIPREILPQSLKEGFVSEKYSRIVVNLSVYGENEQSYKAIDDIKKTATDYYGSDWYMAGVAPSVTDIKETVEKDSIIVNMFSIIAVGLIVLLTFKSVSIPLLLVSVIEASIWINMSIPHFEGKSLVFIGYLVVSALQLGATIDYAILLTNRYMENRRNEGPKESASLAVKQSGGSVLISSLILTVAGFAEGIISKIGPIKEIGILLGRGAALSGFMVIIVLPALLVIFDKPILFTTLNTKGLRGRG